MNSVLSMLLVYYLISFVTFYLIVYLCFFSIETDMWIYVFVKADDGTPIPLNEISILKGDRIMISEENCKTFGLCFGKVLLEFQSVILCLLL